METREIRGADVQKWLRETTHYPEVMFDRNLIRCLLLWCGEEPHEFRLVATACADSQVSLSEVAWVAQWAYQVGREHGAREVVEGRNEKK
jgi:hypothetical protein